MKLTELCQVIQDVSNITVTLLTSEKDFRNFCKTWQFHDKQDYLKTDTLKWLFHALDHDKLLCYTDCFQIRFCFFWVDDLPVAIGPYCTEILTAQDYKKLEKLTRLSGVSETDLPIYRSRFPVTQESSILHLAHCILKHMLHESTTKQILRIDAHTFYNQNAPDTDILYKPYSMLVQERYKTELEFMENIRLGNRTAALKNWKNLHNSVDFLKKRIGYTLEGARISAAVTRTTIRLAGMEAGLPAELGDWLTSIE